jgi:nicotinate phosphoribosyltransferase
MTGQIIDVNGSEVLNKDIIKCRRLVENNILFSEFGTRRRYSYENQERIVRLFTENAEEIFLGTSNVYFAYKYKTKAIGTVAHEWFMVHGALYGYKLANKLALDNWYNVFNGFLGIALSDTYTSDYFIKNFDVHNAKLFDGVRQDSGDPFLFVDKIIDRYKELNINHQTKLIIFSDNLNIDLAVEIKNYCTGKIKPLFGIGTHFTNDLGVNPLNIVIKISSVMINNEWLNTVKLTDDPMKYSHNSKEIEHCINTIKGNN